MELTTESIKWAKFIGGEGFKCSEVVDALCCTLKNRFTIEAKIYLNYGNAY